MRIQLEIGNRSVDLEDTNGNYPWDEDEKFLELVSDALLTMGYSKETLLKYLVHKEE